MEVRMRGLLPSFEDTYNKKAKSLQKIHSGLPNEQQSA